MNNKGYILYVLSFLPTYVWGEINELLKRGVKIKILMLGNSPRSLMWEKISGLNEESDSFVNRKIVIKYIIDTRELNGIKDYNKIAETLSQIFVDEPVSRVHVHFAKKEAHIGLRLAKILGVPFSVSTHSNDIFVPQNKDELTYLLNESQLIFSISGFSKKCVESYLKNNTNRVKALHLGINLNKMPSRIKAKRSFFSIYATASGLAEPKGLQYLILACEILKTKGITFKCTIVGSDPDGKVLNKLKEQIKTHDLSGQINLPGVLPSRELLEQIASCDVFILPCAQASDGTMDGIPISLLEAMGTGVPVISTSISGIPEVISNGENGLLVTSKDPVAIADALIYILEHPVESEKMGNCAQHTIKNNFNVEDYAYQLLKYWGMNSL